MKNILTLLIAVACIAFVNLTATAQTDSTPQVLEVEEIAQAGVITLGVTNTIATPINSNEIFITQIGNSNVANIAAQSSNSIIAVQQFGNQNDIDFFAVAPSINYAISQNGDSNVVKEYTPFNNNTTLNIQTIQNGNNNLIDKFGSNQLTEGMKITQSGDNLTMVIRSY